MSSNCDWPDDFCDDGENWTSTCVGCGRWLRVCDYHYGYHIMFAVLGPPCPRCSTRNVAAEIPDVPALTFTRVLFAWQR